MIAWVAAAALATAVGSGAVAPPGRSVQRLRYTPGDRTSGRFQHVPLDVPPGTTRLTFSYRYDRAGGLNVVDLGLMEPGSREVGTAALRGWSGGSRSEVVVAVDEATPGYWPGPLPPGRWHVVLGLYKVADGGVEVELTTETSGAPAKGPMPTLAPRSKGPLAKGPAWWSGALHVHTVHSDGQETAAVVARLAREAGLQFIAITDHNNTTHQLEPIAEEGLLRIVGEEITTPAGHANVWGLGGGRDEIDFRVAAGDAALAGLVRKARAKGALVAINHPRLACGGCSWEHGLLDGIEAIEVANGGDAERAAAIALWDEALRRGRRLTGVGTSDWHDRQRPIDVPSVRVWADELSERAILEGVRRGRVVVMAEGRLPPPELVVRDGGRRARVGDTLAVAAGTTVDIEVAAEAPAHAGARVELLWDGVPVGTQTLAPGSPARFSRRVEAAGYARVHVHAADGRPLAITNPVFVALGPAR
jgi:hypothetical protein